MINRRHRAVVKVRCGCPDAVERRGLIAAAAQAMIGLARGTVLAGEPALEVMRHAFRGKGVRQGGIGAGHIEWYELVGVAGLAAVRAVAAPAVVLEDGLALLGLAPATLIASRLKQLCSKTALPCSARARSIA